MKKKITIGVLLLVVLILINAVIGGVLVFFIQDIREPKIDVEFNLSQITTDELRFTARILMKNDNQFDFVAKNFNIIGKTPEGNTILDIEFLGGNIAAKQQRIFTANETVSFSGEISSKIYASIQGIFGVTLAGIFEKTIPFQINITASFQDLFNNISTPKLSLLAEVIEITGDGVLFKGIVNVQNPNFFDMSLEDFTASVETEKGESVGVISKLQGKILSNATSQFLFNGTLFYDALNAKILILRFKGNAGIHMMGIDKTIELSTMAQLPIPDIKELLFHNESLDITISLDVKVRVRGFLTTIGLTLHNPSKIPLQANDLLCSIYGLTGGDQKMIAQKTMEPTSAEPIEVDYLEAQLLVPYIKIFTSGTKKILPDWFVIEIAGDFSLAGVNQSIPVTINATINPHLLRS